MAKSGDNTLFAQEDTGHQPLAFRMRPRKIEEYFGQEHIIGPGRLLRRVIQADQLSSVIFYGPPGTGKTTLARVIANTTKSNFLTMNAVLSGVKDLRIAIEDAKNAKDLYSRRTILFIDEVHRWNKAQQDALLPWVENGTVILIGATTENPYFEVIPALVSRSRVFQLKSLTKEDLLHIAQSAINDPQRGYGKYQVVMDQEALDHLVNMCNGDARSLLNALELAVETTPDTFPPEPGSAIVITRETAEESIQKKVLLYDKEGDYHFDTISAFIKSIRGSDPDAVLYWMARMIRGGEDPRFIFRRMLISASEDIGLADPQALVIVQSAAAAFDRVGMPEGQFFLTEAALYLATAEKSNSAMGFFDAAAAVEEDFRAEVPNHLRDDNRDAKGFGHGQGYQYPHAYRNHWVAQAYLPGQLKGKVFYTPSRQGHEKTIHDKVLEKREAQLEIDITPPPEILTFSPPDSIKKQWLDRVVRGASETMEILRSNLFSRAELQRHHRVLIPSEQRGFLLWEAFRQVPEGSVAAFIPKEEDLETVKHFASRFKEYEQPLLIPGTIDEKPENLPHSFDIAIGMNLFTRIETKPGLAEKIRKALDTKGIFISAEIIPRKGMRLSQFLREYSETRHTATDGEPLTGTILEGFTECEKMLEGEEGNPLLAWDEEDLRKAVISAGFSSAEITPLPLSESRYVSKQDIDRWFNPDLPAGYGSLLPGYLSQDEIAQSEQLLRKILENQVHQWEMHYVIIKAAS